VHGVHDRAVERVRDGCAQAGAAAVADLGGVEDARVAVADDAREQRGLPGARDPAHDDRRARRVEERDARGRGGRRRGGFGSRSVERTGGLHQRAWHAGDDAALTVTAA
jgi:hypothetical protein